MSNRRFLLVCVLVVVAARAGAHAINVQLSQDDIRRATEFARFPHTDAERARFHSRYTVAVSGPLVDYFTIEQIEVITPFRRLELIAEEHARINDLFARGGLHDAEEALQPWRDQLSVIVHLRFDQTKVIPDVPAADVILEEGPRLVVPFDIHNSGIYTFDGDRRWLVGGLVEALFNIREIGQTKQTVVVQWNGKEIARVPVNFAVLE